MLNDQKIEKFRQIVENKFQIYNSLFMSLPYDKMTNIGMLLPFLYEESKEGYQGHHLDACCAYRSVHRLVVNPGIIDTRYEWIRN